MVIIRLARMGKKNSPFYHIVATNKRSPRDGRHIEPLGYFNPSATSDEIRLQIQSERVAYWQSVGAQTSPRVATLLKQAAKEKIQAT